jgi:hypothetical protein
MSPHMLLKAEEISNLPPKKPQILKISRINITIVFLIGSITTLNILNYDIIFPTGLKR